MSVLELAQESEDPDTIEYLNDVVEQASMDLRAASIRGDAQEVKRLIEKRGARLDTTDAVRVLCQSSSARVAGCAGGVQLAVGTHLTSGGGWTGAWVCVGCCMTADGSVCAARSCVPRVGARH